MASTGYAPGGELRMYYEIHGQGRPLILLHGANMTIPMMEPLLAGLAEDHQVIAVELQGHGRTADVAQPLTYEQMADDLAAAMRHLEVESADVVGFSLGGGVAVQLAVRHPALVRKLVVISAAYRQDGMHEEGLDIFRSMTPELFAGTPMEQAYRELAPHPDDFANLVHKLKALETTRYAWPEEDIKGISAPTLIIVADSDMLRLEHMVEFFRLRGGGVAGDVAGVPESQFAVLPGTTHFAPGSSILDRSEWMLAMIRPFLE